MDKQHQCVMCSYLDGKVYKMCQSCESAYQCCLAEGRKQGLMEAAEIARDRIKTTWTEGTYAYGKIINAIEAAAKEIE